MLSEVTLSWKKTFRLIYSKFPPIDFFENLVDPSLMDELFYVESLTNDRLRNEVGDISLVSREDRVSGNGSSVVMAAFTHVSRDRPSRFSDGTFGIYYAASSIETAIREKAFHTEKFLSHTQQSSGMITIRLYESRAIVKPLIDIRGKNFENLHHPTNYIDSQTFALQARKNNHWGIVYNSVRHIDGECVAILRPPAVPLPVNQTKHFNLIWDGKRIREAVEMSGVVYVVPA